MGTIIVGGGLLIVVALIVFNMIRRAWQGKSAFCTSSSCDCSCSAGVFCQPYQKTQEKETSSPSCCCSGHAPHQRHAKR